MTIDDGVTFAPSSGTLAASASGRGDIAYAIGVGEPDTQLFWMDRSGRTTLALNQSGEFGDLAVAPDGERFVTARNEGMSGQQIWVGDAARATLVPLTHGSNDCYGPVWSPDGTRVAFSSRETGNEDVYIQSASGTTPWEMVHSGKDHDTVVTDWSKDGRYVFFSAHPRADASRGEIWVYDVQQKSARSVLSDSFVQSEATLSPDGRWLAYTSEEGGSPQIFIRPFPALDRKWLVSGKNAAGAHWRDDGREIVYTSHDDTGAHSWSVAIAPTAAGPNPGVPAPLFPLEPTMGGLAPTGDHARFLVTRDVKRSGENAIRVILDWKP